MRAVAKRATILRLTCKGVWKVIYDYTTRTNPFCVYYYWSGHQKLMERYADLGSCLVYLANAAGWVERYGE